MIPSSGVMLYIAISLKRSKNCYPNNITGSKSLWEWILTLIIGRKRIYGVYAKQCTYFFSLSSKGDKVIFNTLDKKTGDTRLKKRNGTM